MATNVPIQSTTLTTSQSSYTFSNIDQTYTDLTLVISGVAGGGTGGNIWIQFNGDTSSGLYSRTRVLGDGSNMSSERQANQNWVTIGDAANGEQIGLTIWIPQYSNPNVTKSVLSRSYSSNYVSAYAGLWRNSSPITSITFTMGASQSIGAGTTLSLYGVAAGSPKASGGNTYTDGTYWYHLFTSSGTFTPALSSLSCDILQVAGGASGGAGFGGGGGAGGVLLTQSYSLPSLPHQILVGAGAAWNSIQSGGFSAGTIAPGSNGNNSSIGRNGTPLLIAYGGGGGGSYGSSATQIGRNGGSGGGAGGGSPVANASGGTGTAGQGNNGGNGTQSGNNYTYAASGGGGAGGNGIGNSANTAGNGGIGVTSITISQFASATGTGVNDGSGNYYFGGGGGGGTADLANSTRSSGGFGGGGAGERAYSNNSDSVAGSAFTGGGGGGGSYASTSGSGNTGGGKAGGSGLVIVRYLV